MKSSHLYITLLATASLALAGTAGAQSNRSTTGTNDSHDSTKSISRVTKDTVKNRLTAKDLIGADVYDHAGQKIGDIADIDLQGALPATVATSFNAAKANHSSGAATTSSADTMNNPSSSTTSSSMSGEMSHATIYLSVGGLWGVGDDLVSVPASQLTYNVTEKRFELPANKADIVALAEQKSSDYASGTAPMSRTSAGKQSFSDEATRVQNALEHDPMTSAFAQKVFVITNGETLEIHGSVDNKEQQKKILDTARRSTSLKVEDKIDVR